MKNPTRFLTTLRSSWAQAGTASLRAGFLAAQSLVLMGDLERNQPLENFAEIPGQRLLILTAPNDSPGSHRILENVMEAFYSNNSMLKRLDAKEAKGLFQSHLSLERRFFEDATHSIPENDYQGYLLLHQKLYPLHREGTLTCFIYRDNRLLEFHLIPHQFIPLEPGDLLLLTPDMKSLLDQKKLREITHGFRRSPFHRHYIEKGLQRVEPLLTGPLIGLLVTRTREKRPLGTPQQFSLTYNQRLILLFIVMWAIALIAAQWLNA